MASGSAKQRLLDYFKKHLNEWIPYTTLNEVAKISEWARVVRMLRQEGWEIEQHGGGLNSQYKLSSLEKGKGKERDYINKKLRAEILNRDNYRCIHCGKNPKEDGVKLHIDHKIPVDWGGKTVENNLQTLCGECNEGKKAYFADFDKSIMKKITKTSSGIQKLLLIAKEFKNKPLKAQYISVLVNIRDWTRTIRKLRQEGKINYNYDRKDETYTFLDP